MSSINDKPENIGHSPEQAAADAMNGGVDLDCGPHYQDYLRGAVAQGLTSRAKVSAATQRVLRHQIMLGLLDSESKYSTIGLEEVGSAAHAVSRHDIAPSGLHSSQGASISLLPGADERGRGGVHVPAPE